jgi:hypothetical protein
LPSNVPTADKPTDGATGYVLYSSTREFLAQP